MWTCQGSANQRLAFHGSGNTNGSFLRFQHSGLCMDVAGGNRITGALLLQWNCAFQENQRFSFVEPSTPSSESFEQSTRTFRNVMVINEQVNEGGRFLHRFDERLMLRLEYAFTETFPALINELTDGLIQFENSVVRNPQTIFINRRRTEGDCGSGQLKYPTGGILWDLRGRMMSHTSKILKLAGCGRQLVAVSRIQWMEFTWALPQFLGALTWRCTTMHWLDGHTSSCTLLESPFIEAF